jgi:hypothetical protein
LRIFSRLFRSRDKPRNSLGGGFAFLFGPTASGKRVNEKTALATSAVYACVRILAESIAGLPLHVYAHAGKGGKERAPEHPLYPILHDSPNPEMTSLARRKFCTFPGLALTGLSDIPPSPCARTPSGCPSRRRNTGASFSPTAPARAGCWNTPEH